MSCGMFSAPVGSTALMEAISESRESEVESMDVGEEQRGQVHVKPQFSLMSCWRVASVQPGMVLFSVQQLQHLKAP